MVAAAAGLLVLWTGPAQLAAVDVVEQLGPSTVTAVSLAELYAELCCWSDIMEPTDGLGNDGEAATHLLIQRGMASREQEFVDASREASKEALRIRSRPAQLRQRPLIERGLACPGDGRRSPARKDFERVLAENSTHPGLQDHPAALQD
jgi:hypothetical protein